MDHSDTLPPEGPPDDIPGTVLISGMRVAGDVFNAYHDDDGSLGLEAPSVIVARALHRSWQRGYLAGFKASGEGWNGEYPFEGKDPEADAHWLETRNRSQS